jgi:hypothetical protein
MTVDLSFSLDIIEIILACLLLIFNRPTQLDLGKNKTLAEIVGAFLQLT